MVTEVLILTTSLLGTATLSLIGWTARELYRTSQNQTALEHRVRENENKIKEIFKEV